MDVTLPNGYVIKGVPDGVSKEEIKQKAIAGGYASEADFTSQQRSGMQTIGDVVGTVPLGINAQREALKTMVTGAIAQPIAGLVGLGQTLNPFAEPGAGARAVNQVQDALTYQPDASGQQILEGQAEMLQPVTDAIDMARTGDRTMEATGSPLLSTINQIAPEIVGSMIGIKGLQQARATAQPSMTDVRQNGKMIPLADGRVKGAPIGQPKFTPTGRIEPTMNEAGRIKISLQKGEANPKAAKFKLDAKTGAVIDDPIAIKAGKTGWDDNVIQITKTAAKNPANRIKGLKMVAETRRSLKDLEYGASNRPSQVIGESVFERYKILKAKNSAAGGKLSGIAKTQLNKPVNAQPIIAKLDAQINEFGGVIGENGKLKFPPGSGLYGTNSNISVMTKVFNQAKSLPENPTGYQLHRFKGWIDDLITETGSQQKGATGKTQRFLESFRKDINDKLRGVSEDYKQANIQYSETKTAIDALGEVFGKKRFFAEGGSEVTGQMMRKWISNSPNRQNMINAFRQADETATKYGGKFSDTMEAQILMGNALDDLLTKANPLTRSTFKADIRAATDPKGVLLEKTAGKAVGKVGKLFGYTDDPLEALNAIEDLLRSSSE